MAARTGEYLEATVMKIGIAMMSHETNTFSPVITDLERFSGGHGQPLKGQTALQTYRGTASCLGGYIEVAEAQQVDIEMGVAAGYRRRAGGGRCLCLCAMPSLHWQAEWMACCLICTVR